MPLLLFLLWIFLETLLLMRLAQFGGGWVPLYLVAAMIAGSLIIRRHGLRAVRQVREAMARGELPATALVEGLLGFAAGALLILPGLLSDAMALGILLMRRRLARQLDQRMAAARPDLRAPVTIEGEYRDATRPPDSLPPP